jgi:hypothetical protein
MLKQLRQAIVSNLWEKFHHKTAQIKLIEKGLKQKGIIHLPLDHFAVIDLPGPHTGINPLAQLFSSLGYSMEGHDYLADKQNDFAWMSESDSRQSLAKDVLPQIVVADFRLDEMPASIKKIIEKYSHQSPRLPLSNIQRLIERASRHDLHAAKDINHIILDYLCGRDWPLPTKKEFSTVQEFNELLAWVLIFGRQPNHFTVAVHLLNHFSNLNEFNRFIEEEVNLTLNQDGGVIKGNETVGITQSSTIGNKQTLKFADGEAEISTEFVEFVWRFPHTPTPHLQPPLMWKDYFTGFIPQHADHVIQSLYIEK